MKTLAFFAIIFYLLATGSALHVLAYGNKHSRLPLLVSATLALITHALWLSHQISVTPPTSSFNMIHVASLTSLIICTFLTLFASRFNGWQLLPIAYSFALGLFSLTLFFPLNPTVNFPMTPLSLTHLGLSIIAYTMLIIATLFALQQQYLNLRLKSHRLDLQSHVPALVPLEQRVFTLITSGEILLTLSILMGLYFMQPSLHGAHIHRILLSLTAWSIYLVLICGHFKYGWRGKSVVWMSVIGALVLTLAYFGGHLVRVANI